MIIALVCLSLLAGYLVFKNQSVNGQLIEANNLSAELYDRVINAEKEQAKAEQHRDFLKQTIVEMLNRTVVAAMSDQQVNQITQSIIQYIASVSDPKKLN